MKALQISLGIIFFVMLDLPALAQPNPCVPDSFPACPGFNRDNEPANNFCDIQTNPSIFIGDTLRGVIPFSNDDDWYLLNDLDGSLDYFRYEIEVWDGSSDGRCTFGSGSTAQVEFYDDCSTQIPLVTVAPGIYQTTCLQSGVFHILIDQDFLFFPCMPYVFMVRKIYCPPGDVFCNAIPIPSLPYCICGNTEEFGDDVNITHGAPDVFFSFTVPSEQVVTTSLCNSDFNACVASYRGTTLCDVMVYGSQNCDGCSSLNQGCTQIFVEPGFIYTIRVDGAQFGDQEGDFELYLQSGFCCPNCGPCNADDECQTTPDDIEPDNNTCASGIINCDTTCGNIANPADVDWYNLFVPIQDTLDRHDLIIRVLGNGVIGDFPCFTALNPLLVVNQPCGVEIGRDSSSGEGGDCYLELSCVDFTGVNAVAIGVSGENGTSGKYKLIVECSLCRPYGDDCFNPVQIDSLPFCWTEVDCVAFPPRFNHDYSPPCSTGGGGFLRQNATDIVFRYQPQMNQTITANALGSNYNTALSCYEGNCPDQGGMFLDCDTECLEGLDLMAGETYYFILDGYGSPEEGDGVFYISEDPNCVPCGDISDPCPYPSRDDETTNDNCTTTDFTNTLLECGNVFCGNIETEGEQDWYVLDAGAPGNPLKSVAIRIFADDTPNQWSFERGLDPQVWLYAYDISTNICQSAVAFDRNGGAGNDCELTSNCGVNGVSEEVYYKVLVEGEASSTGPYILSVECNTCTGEDALCTFDCLPGSRSESETCAFEQSNDGCYSEGAFMADSIGCDDKICGTSFGHNLGMFGAVDSDWYRLTLASPESLRFECVAEFDAMFILMRRGPDSNACVLLDTLKCALAPACSMVAITACVGRGEYYFMTRPYLTFGETDSFDCKKYNFEVSCTPCTPPVCQPATNLRTIFDVATNTLDILWNPSPNADRYYVYMSQSSPPEISPATYLGYSDISYFGIDPPSGKWTIIVVAYCKGEGCSE